MTPSSYTAVPRAAAGISLEGSALRACNFVVKASGRTERDYGHDVWGGGLGQQAKALLRQYRPKLFLPGMRGLCFHCTLHGG